MLKILYLVALQRPSLTRSLTTLTPAVKDLLNSASTSVPVQPGPHRNLTRCFHNSSLCLSEVPNTNPSVLGKVDVKMRLLFTCKKCNTRNDKLMSKLAYEKGIVVVRCDGCQNLHLIADNLDWFKNPHGRNIEQILAGKGQSVKRTSGSFEVENWGDSKEKA